MKTSVAAFQHRVMGLPPHDGRGRVHCSGMHTDRRRHYHHAIFTASFAVSNDSFFRRRWENLSDVRESLASARPPLSLSDFKNARLSSYIGTAPVLADMEQRAEIVRFWLTGGTLLGQLGRRSQLRISRGVIGSVFDCRRLLDASGLIVTDLKDLYVAALPSMDKEIHFLRDGAQHVLGNVKITDLQHNLAKGHTFMPLHADLLEVILISRQLIDRVLPTKARSLSQSIGSSLTRQEQLGAARSFIANTVRAWHDFHKRSAGDGIHFGVAERNLIRGIHLDFWPRQRWTLCLQCRSITCSKIFATTAQRFVHDKTIHKKEISIVPLLTGSTASSACYPILMPLKERGRDRQSHRALPLLLLARSRLPRQPPHPRPRPR